MDPSLKYILDVERLSHLATDLPREAIRVATLFDGKRKLWEVLRDSLLTSRMTMSVFGRLRELELLYDQGSEPVILAAPEPEILAAPEPEPVILAAPEPVAPPVLEVSEVADTVVTAIPALEVPEMAETVVIESPAPAAAATDDFDEADHAFFDSYEPEDLSVDTFWDLEENPRKQRAARTLQNRLNRRRTGGWLASLLLT